jgi:hypothetical protein
VAVTLTYMPEQWFNGADIFYMDGEGESITDRSVQLALEGLYVSDGGYGPNVGKPRFIPWIHIRELKRR